MTKQLLSAPILVSHNGKLALLHPDGSKTTPDGKPLPADVPKATAQMPKRWHDPYA